MHLVVVGGNGFIGSHFVAAAAAAGHRITVVGHSPEPRMPHGFTFAFRPGGLRWLAEDAELLRSCDLVCHFATSMTPATSNADPLADINTNLFDTVRLLEAMRLTGNRRILFLSSGGAVYGQPQYLPMDEAHPLNPLSSYGVVKSAIEQYLRLYQANYGFAATIVRPANPYGPGQTTIGQLGAVNTFVHLAQAGQPATLWGDGTTVRDFVYVSDVVALLLACAESDTTGTYNCGGGTGTSLLNLICVVEQITGKHLERQFKPARGFDPAEVVLDISRARNAFGWQPLVSLRDGVAKTAGDNA